jgi:hypothetical protein
LHRGHKHCQQQQAGSVQDGLAQAAMAQTVMAQAAMAQTAMAQAAMAQTAMAQTALAQAAMAQAAMAQAALAQAAMAQAAMAQAARLLLCSSSLIVYLQQENVKPGHCRVVVWVGWVVIMIPHPYTVMHYPQHFAAAPVFNACGHAHHQQLAAMHAAHMHNMPQQMTHATRDSPHTHTVSSSNVHTCTCCVCARAALHDVSVFCCTQSVRVHTAYTMGLFCFLCAAVSCC